MPYSVDTFSGSRTFVVEDGTINSSLDIRLIGKNYAGYGEVQNENFVHLLENFAGVNPPPRPTNGQIWYDAFNKKIKFWDDASTTWKSTGGVAVATTAPTGLTAGDLWWNSNTNQLFAYNGNSYVLVGPQGIEGYGKTAAEAELVMDSLGLTHIVLTAYVDGAPMFIVSTDDEFTLGNASQLEFGGASKFGVIKKGITLVGTNNVNGSSTDSVFWGTTSKALTAVDSASATTLNGGTAGAIVYQASTGTTSFVPSNPSTTRKILSQTGNGTTPSAPEWIILPTVLPISQNNGTILNIPLANGTFSVQDRSGNLVNISVN
jgi:hypothetical protein